MHKVCGFALFWIAVGMAIALIIDSTFWDIAIIMACIIIGYNLFCYRC